MYIKSTPFFPKKKQISPTYTSSNRSVAFSTFFLFGFPHFVARCLSLLAAVCVRLIGFVASEKYCLTSLSLSLHPSAFS